MKALFKMSLVILLCVGTTTACSSGKKKPKNEPPMDENFYPLYLD